MPSNDYNTNVEVIYIYIWQTNYPVGTDSIQENTTQHNILS